MNSPTVNGAISARFFGPLSRLVLQIPSDEELAVELYLRALSREPNDKELAICLVHFGQANSRSEATEDLMWSLLNSTEFLYRR
jgi:hypothetical protein